MRPNRLLFTNVCYLGTIYCNFDKDWCDFHTKNEGDDPAKQGFNWMRKTSNEVENQGLDGPDKGNILSYAL